MITTIIGYSIDACVYTRELAESGNQIKFLQTGTLGFPLDSLKDCIYEDSVNKIKSFVPKLEFNKFVNYTYTFVPYNQLEFVNTHNGLISFPLNKKSFECAEEWEQIQSCILNLDKFKNKLEHSNNYINIYKKFFPKWVHNSLIKHISVNKWNQKQSKFTKECLAKEINVEFLDGPGTSILFSPVKGYENICLELLNHPNIKTTEVNILKLKKFIIERQKTTEVIFMDNRIDHLTGYAQGRFERVAFNVETTSNVNQEEFFDINDAIVMTPFKDYFCITNSMGKISKIFSKQPFSDFTPYTVVPSVVNKKLYVDYQKLLHLYSGKHLNLDTYIKTVIV